MTDKKSSESRRKLLKSIAAGSGAIVAGKSLPDSWSRPVVDSVMLPAHAQTSPVEPPVEPPVATTLYYCTAEQVAGFSVAVSGATATIIGNYGGSTQLDPIGTPKYAWEGNVSTANTTSWTGTIATTNLGTTTCIPGGNFEDPRPIEVFLTDGVPSSIGIWNASPAAGDPTDEYDLTASATPCALPAIADCV